MAFLADHGTPDVEAIEHNQEQGKRNIRTMVNLLLSRHAV
jgi:hypothetical protein